MSWVVGIDVGGTFTDLHALHPETGRVVQHKTPSTPSDPAEAILGGLDALCRQHAIPPAAITRLSHGSTVATNALIQRRGGTVALVVTAGFRDLLEIGRQTRPRIYDFQTDHPPALVPRDRRIECVERVTRGGRVITPLTPEEVARVVAAVQATGAEACAICFLFAFLRPEHERTVAAALRAAIPGLYLSLSSEVQPEFREYERLSTTVLNAYLQPVMTAYLERFQRGAATLAPQARLGISQSSGGLISAERARLFPIRTALSGPAAGAAGAVRVAQAAGAPRIITLDIGGTSTDIALIRDFTPDTVFERWIEGYPARMPSVDIHAIGAGGGSIAWIDGDGLVKVGPHSAGAAPGPACYGRGGTQATLSDANLVLGRLSASGLLGGAMAMREDLAAAAIDALADRIGLGRMATALGIVDIAVATMVRGIRTVSIERGHDPRVCTLLAFGGAGPLHAAAVAHSLRIGAILVPPHPGLLCAEGLLAADQLEHFVASVRLPVDAPIGSEIAGLRAQAAAWFVAEDVPPSAQETRISLDMRYVGQNFELNVPLAAEAGPDALQHAFYAVHDRAYGFHNPGAPVEIVGIRLLALGARRLPQPQAQPIPAATTPTPASTRPVWFDRDGPSPAAVFARTDLRPGHVIPGPAIIEQFDSTTLVFPQDIARVDGPGTLRLEDRRMTAGLDAITLEIILNGLRSITDETFIALMKSAYSTNIKERHDHSTALIDAQGRLVAFCERSQPIHLSSMLGLTTTLLAKYAPEEFRPGDIFVANDPYAAGGSHLPDVNLSMPVFVDGTLLCFMCNIAHHADIGGMAPGSMSGGMTEIYQEGLRIPPIRLFDGGRLLQDVLDLLLLNARVPEERRGDYFAQIASCKLGERRLMELAGVQGGPTLAAAFDALIERTHARTKTAIRRIPPGTYRFTDVMDDDGFGATDIPIEVTITAGDPRHEGRLLVDFTGTAPVVRGNINIPFRSTQSSVLYVIRSLLDPEVATNQGLLDAIEIVCPPGTLLNASFPAAVAGRANTCQRIVDVMLGALQHALPTEIVAASNGANTMVVLSGHDPASGRPYVYLETFGGGFGGRATKDGKDGVQVHLINTSNLPVEAIESEYPLLIESYGLVEDSGGAGTFRGGLGLRRVIRPLDHTMMFTGQGERFVHQPWGIFGGAPGAVGRFLLRGPDATTPLPTKPGLTAITPAEAIVVETAGGGGYGPAAGRDPAAVIEDRRSGKFSAAVLDAAYPRRPA